MASREAPATNVVRLSTEEVSARRLADALSETFDPGEAAVAAFEVGPGRWDVEVHFEQPPDQAQMRALFTDLAGEDAGRALTFAVVAGKDWVAASLEGLAPVAAGRFVVHGAHDRARVPPQRIGIEIEAALAFGTGHHGTTRGCLLALDRLIKARTVRPRRTTAFVEIRRRRTTPPVGMLDVGTGTGVLAIAAARALRQRARASDIDGRAVAVARDNARANRSGALIDFVQAAGLGAHRITGGRYHLILANILLPPLQRMAAPMARLVRRGGYVVLSGLMDSQAAAALATYRAQGLVLHARLSLDGWTTLILARGTKTTKRPERLRPGR